MHVDETGADEQPVRVNGSVGGLVGQAADSRNPVADDAEVSAHPRVTRPIDQFAAADQDVEHHIAIKPRRLGGLLFRPGAMTSSAYLFAHDLLDETVAVVLDRLEQAGL